MIGRVQSYVASPEPEIQADLGGGEIVVAEHYGPDAPPLPGDLAVIVPLGESGRSVGAVAYDDESSRAAAPGEYRIYARNPAKEVTAVVYLRADGSVEITQPLGVGAITIDPMGAITLAGVSVSLNSGPTLGEFFTTLLSSLTAYTPSVPSDATAWTAALAPLLAGGAPA